MLTVTRLTLAAGALTVLAAAAPPPPPAGADFPARATGAEGTTVAIEAAGDAERSFQAEKERRRVKEEAARLEREAAARKAAEEARIERERVEREAAAAAEAQRAAQAQADEVARQAAAAAAAEQAKAIQARFDNAQNAGELFALSDELASRGDRDGSRAALRALIARFPDSKLADVATTMLSGIAMPGVAATAPRPVATAATAPVPTPALPPAYVPLPTAPPPAAAPPPAVAANSACIAALAQFNALKPIGTGRGSLAERQVFYGKYYERMLGDVPACRGDAAIVQKVRADLAANLAECQRQPGANCTVGIADAPVAEVDRAYDRVVAQAMGVRP